MSLQVAIIAGLLHITAPATPAPEQYLATAYALPGQQLQWRGFDGWIDPRFCFGRCGTLPGTTSTFLSGGLTEEDAADLQLTLWKLEGDKWVQIMHCTRWFDSRPICYKI